MQQAFGDVANSLVGYSQSRQFRMKIEEQTATYKESARLANVRFTGGYASFLEVLTIEQQYFTSELALMQAWAPNCKIMTSSTRPSAAAGSSSAAYHDGCPIFATVSASLKWAIFAAAKILLHRSEDCDSTLGERIANLAENFAQTLTIEIGTRRARCAGSRAFVFAD